MLITFVGNPQNRSDNRGSVTIGDVEFPLNVAVEVSEKPIFTKLRGNSHFRVEDRPVESTDASKSGKDDADAAKKARVDLIAKAESLGVEFDKRWSVQKIQDAIDAHGRTGAN